MDGMTNADAVNYILLLKLHPRGCTGNRIQLERATM